MSYPTKALADLCEIQIGRTPSRREPAYWGPGAPWVTISDMVGPEISATKETITDRAIQECRCKQVPPGALLMSFKLTIGKVSFARVPLYTNEAIAALSIRDPKVLHDRFLLHALAARDLSSGGDRAAKGLTLNSEKLAAISVPLPPLAEQRRIADLLDAIGDLLRRSEGSLELANALREAIVDEALLDCRSESLGDLALEFRYGTSQKAGVSGVPVLRIPNVTGGEIDPRNLKHVELLSPEITRYRLAENDLLLVRSNGNPEFIGRCAVFDGSVLPSAEAWVFASYLIRVRLRASVDAHVVSAYLQSLSGRAQLLAGCRTSAGQYNINTEALKGLSIPVPSPQAQRKLRRLLRAVSAQRDRVVHFRARLLASQDSIRERAMKT